jgi:hypothetical protein
MRAGGNLSPRPTAARHLSAAFRTRDDTQSPSENLVGLFKAIAIRASGLLSRGFSDEN